MGERQLLEAVSKGRQGGRAVQPLLTRSPEVRTALLDAVTRRPAQAGTCFKAAVPRPLVFRFVLELWSGTRRFSSAMAKLGYTCKLVDMRFSDGHGITKPELQKAIIGRIRAGHALYTWMGVLCKSWSRARNMPGGPCMLRSSEFVMGLGDIKHAGDRTQVTEGNGMMRFAAQVMRTVFGSNSGAAIENPWSSWIWQARPFRALVTHHGFHLARTGFCMFGTPWQKGTGICTNSNPAYMERRCTGVKRGLCARTLKPHIELRGTLPDGRCLTAVAEQYPRSSCTALARMAHNHIVSLAGEKWSHHAQF